MAQLDKYIFFTQVFWFLLFFVGFYFIMLKWVFPSLFFMIRLRVLRLQELKAQSLPEDRKAHNNLVIKDLTNVLGNLSSFVLSLLNEIKSYSYSLSLNEVNKWNSLLLINQKKTASYFSVLDRLALRYQFYIVNWLMGLK
jgi:hypothetical protein